MSTFDERIKRLKQLKLQQTDEKIRCEGLLDEDDYGRIVPPKGLWNIRPNHPDGSFYGFDAWADNFCSLMDVHPTYINPDDAFAGRWMYFMSKMRPNKWNPEYDYKELKPKFEKYDIICGIGDDAHFAPDYEMGLKLGWRGIKEKVMHYKTVNPEAAHFYDLHLRAIESVQGWIRRHVDTALNMMGKAHSDEEKRLLKEIADTNNAVIEEAPETFRQACQWIIWYHLASRTYNRDGAGGQLDSLLMPYYERDRERGIITREEAVYFLSCFLINDPIYWQLGGPDETGKDQTCEMSFMILEAADKIDTSLNITVRVHEGLDPELLKKSVEYLVKNKNGWPRFSGDRALVDGFMKLGYSAELARKRIAVGCNWMSLPGLEYTMNDLVKINMAKVFEVGYQEMLAEGNCSTGRLWELFKKHLEAAVRITAEGVLYHLKYQKYNEPELLLNLLSHGPIEKGRDASDGGATYYNLAIDGAGLAIVADSFAALEERVEMQHKFSWQQINEALKNNWKDAEMMRTVMKNSEHYGVADSLGEKWAEKVKEVFVKDVREQSFDNKVFIPGFFSWANTIDFGKHVGATPNGRFAGKPIAHGANPVPGFTSDGASLALASSIAHIQPGYGNTAPMQWELDPTFAKEDNVDMIAAIIKTHFEMGGTLINVNIMDKDKVLAAHKDPSLYPELVVRVTGFTAYFSMLSKDFRQLVVDRILES